MSSAASAEWLTTREERLQSSKAVYRFQTLGLKRERLSQLGPDRLWVSDPATFNDPLDLQLELKDLTRRGPFNESGNARRLKAALACLLYDNKEVELHWFYDGKLIETLRQWSEDRLPGGDSPENHVIWAFKRRVASFGVTCFSPEWENTLMWSHYADNHSGFCVEYMVHPLHFASSGENRALGMHTVQYVSALPELCYSEALFAPHQLLGRMLATKHIDWSYEKEWRLVHYESKQQLVDMPAHMQISALIAGQKMDPELLRQLKGKAWELGIPAFHVRPRNGYEMQLMPI